MNHVVKNVREEASKSSCRVVWTHIFRVSKNFIDVEKGGGSLKEGKTNAKSFREGLGMFVKLYVRYCCYLAKGQEVKVVKLFYHKDLTYHLKSFKFYFVSNKKSLIFINMVIFYEDCLHKDHFVVSEDN